MEIIDLPLQDAKKIRTPIHRDTRGSLSEVFRADIFQAALGAVFVQENLTVSRHNVVRGLHFQCQYPQGKLIQAVCGEICDVLLDLRRGSPTFGKTHSEILCGADGQQLWIPPGFAHGFSTLSETSVVRYFLTDYYRAGDQGCLKPDDPALKIDWRTDEPILSAQDKNGLFFEEWIKL